MKHRLGAFLTIGFLLTVNSVFSQPGTLDSDFDADGILILSNTGELNHGYCVSVQPDGKILVGGTSSIGGNTGVFVARLYPDGSLDNSFGVNGVSQPTFAVPDVTCNDMALQPDGKIVVAGNTIVGGSYSFFAARIDETGSLDNSFGVNGASMFSIGTGQQFFNDMAMQDDGKIVLVGGVLESDIDLAIARLNTDGSLDNTFSFDGKLITDINGSDLANGVQIDTDGKIVVVGESDNESLLVRYNADGTLDNSFGVNGKVVHEFSTTSNDELNCLVIDGDEKLVVAGGSYGASFQEMLVARFNPDGSLDNTFSFDGSVHTDFFGSNDKAKAILIQPDGKILVAGDAHDGVDKIGMVRYDAYGALDNSFGTNGKVSTAVGSTTRLNDMVLQPDGRILGVGVMFSGYYSAIAVRYISGVNIGIGEVDAYIGSTLVYPNPITNNEVTIEYELKSNEMVSIELFDLTGKMIVLLQPSTFELGGKHKKQLSLPDIAAGTYLLHLNTDRGTVVVKLKTI